jgi:hypothetical protein
MNDYETIDAIVKSELNKFLESRAQNSKIGLLPFMRATCNGLFKDFSSIYEFRKEHIFYMSLRRILEEDKNMQNELKIKIKDFDWVINGIDLRIKQTVYVKKEITIKNDITYSERAPREQIKQEYVKHLLNVKESGDTNNYLSDSSNKSGNYEFDLDDLYTHSKEEELGLNNLHFNDDYFDSMDSEIDGEII